MRLVLLVLLVACFSSSVGSAVPYRTMFFSYSDAIHDPVHSNGFSEDEIVGWYDAGVVGEQTFAQLQDHNKPKVFLYVDVWGKYNYLDNPFDIVPAPPSFVTANFPDGHGIHPTNQNGVHPYCYIQTQEYYDDLLSLLDDFLTDLDAQGVSIAGFFLDDWADVAAYWDDTMVQEDIDACWPGRADFPIPWEHDPANPDVNGIWTHELSWWYLDQYPRMTAFEDALHDVLVSHYGTSTLIVNGGARQFIAIAHPVHGSVQWPKYYGDEFSDPDRTTIRCFEGPTVSEDNYINFDLMLKEFSDPDFKYYRKLYEKDLLLMYSIDGAPPACDTDPLANGAYGDWYVGGFYDGLADWTAATDAAYETDSVWVALDYASTPCTGGTRLSLFSDPAQWPYALDLCGNGALDEGEQCDGALLNGQTCEGLGYSGGALSCSASCVFDVVGCTVLYDLDGDGDRDMQDFLLVASDFHQAPGSYAGGSSDLNGDGLVDLVDLVLIGLFL